MRYFIGLMSGTSMDGVDAVLCQISAANFQTVGSISLPFPADLLLRLHALCTPTNNEINEMGRADVEISHLFAQAVKLLLEQHNLAANEIAAIGSHGQTIRHYPDGYEPGLPGFTLQIGDPNTLAALTGIPVVADFRRKDIALGGQGAPLVPAFHQAILGRDIHPTDALQDTHQIPMDSHSTYQQDTHAKVRSNGLDSHRAIVNIGGIANISIVALNTHQVNGYDTGPGNTLMDFWCKTHTLQAFDIDGNWAATGKVNKSLLTNFLADDYFHRQPPKSTGREYFSPQWLKNKLAGYKSVSANDVQATLCFMTAKHIADAITSKQHIKQVFICGGGAYNKTLMVHLRNQLAHCVVTSTSQLGIAPHEVEGAAFAWLAFAYMERLKANVPQVTGASRPAVLGGLYLPD